MSADSTTPAGGATPSGEESNRAKYDLVVGLEVHVQLKTATKIFCGCSTDFGMPPNANTCAVCLALPGALPVLNEHAVELAIRAAAAIGCTIQPTSIFARKHYFYPDLPKGYQISQFDQPLATEGAVKIGVRPDSSAICIGVTRVHMEEDAGKSVHDRFAGVSAVDLNRSGVPLIEIVSEPEIRSADQAGAYLAALKEILEFTEVSDVSMEEGSLRVDANVSTRLAGETALGTKTEVKNMNSFSAVVKAIDVEFARQCAERDAGREIVQQTLLWDEKRSDVRPARSKEGSHDYRYFPEPDLSPLVIAAERIADAKNSLPELPEARRARYRREHANLSEYDIGVLTSRRALGDYFEALVRQSEDAKTSANWMLGEVLAALKSTGQSIEHFTVRPADLAALLRLVRDGVVSHSAGKQIFGAMIVSGDPPSAIAEREGLLKVSDDGPLRTWIDEVFAERPEEAARFVGGEKRLQGVLVGLVMKRSKGSADPKRVNQLLAERVAGT